MGPFWVLVPVNVSSDPDAGGRRYCIISGEFEFRESEADAIKAASLMQATSGADLVLIFLEANRYGFNYIGSCGFRRGTGNYDFPGSHQACEATICEVRARLSSILESRVCIRS